MTTTPNPIPDVTITPADILRGAARYVDLHGWTRDDFYSASHDAIWPAACALGAIGMAVYGRPVVDPEESSHPGSEQFEAARALLVAYLSHTGELFDYDDGELTIADWNDLGGNSANDVIRAFEAAADAWDFENPVGAA